MEILLIVVVMLLIFAFGCALALHLVQCVFTGVSGEASLYLGTRGQCNQRLNSLNLLSTSQLNSVPPGVRSGASPNVIIQG